MTKIRRPLGHIELDTGTKAIMPMHDFFLTYAFNIPENWPTLCSIMNILYQACKDVYKDRAGHIELIEGNVEVKTQYEHMLSDTNNKRQDHLIIGENLTFIEFHNRAKSTPHIEIRGIEYFALGIGKSSADQLANQIWVLGQHHGGVLGEHAFADYVLKDRLNGMDFPNQSSIFYVSLEKLAIEDTVAGELAQFLLGINYEPKHPSVQQIKAIFEKTFVILNEDKGAKYKMTRLDYYRQEARDDRNIELVESMFKKGFEVSTISEILELPIEWIEDLIKNSPVIP